MAEFLCFSNDADRDKMNGLLEAFSSSLSKKPSELEWRALWLAGELLAYYQRRFSAKPSIHEPAIIDNLHRLISDSPLSMRDRADAADVLDQIWKPEDLFKFLPIGDSPTPNLHMAKYLITNSQYERFLKRENFENKKYWVDFPKYDENSNEMANQTWGDEAWNWLQKELQNKNNDIQDGVLLPRYWRDPRFGIARRGAPAVGVSWYEANAYCNWLKEHWDEEDENKNLFKPREVRLPLEKEWAFAAGGEDPKERFPWDRKGVTRFAKTEEIVQRANISESGINRTTPVWMYPQGASPKGVMDMAGNVWEWQANYRDKDHDVLGLRGGSWGTDVVFARVSFRVGGLPDSWVNGFGFRVVSLPSG